jgi:hypothetical protein
MRKTVLTVLVGLTVLAAAQTADAQYYGGGGYGYGAPPPPPRWGYRHRIHGYVGAQLTGIGIVNQKTDASTGEYLGAGGGGGGLFGGVRLGPFFSLELNWNITYHNVAEDYWGDVWSAFHLQTIEVNGKIHIPTRGMIEPYVQLGVGGAFIGVSWDDRWAYDQGDYLLTKGFTFNIGGGLDFWLSPFVSLGGRILYKGMRFGEPYRIQGKTTYANYASAINADLNVALHF